VLRFDLWVVAAHGKALCVGQRRLKLTGEFIHPHGVSPVLMRLKGLSFMWGRRAAFQLPKKKKRLEKAAS
jgi:hypothetical protein